MVRAKDDLFNELQSVRGWMVIMLTIAHSWAYYDMPKWFQTVEKLNNGHARVVAFFVLSGYVVTLGLKKVRLDRNNVIAFYAKRAFRLYPAMFLANTLGLIYVASLHYQIPVNDTSQWLQERYREDRYGPLWIALSFAGLASFLVPPLWTLTIELFLSALMPIIAWLTRLKPMHYALATLATMIVAVTVGHKTPYYVGIYLPAFMLGAGISVIPESIGRRIRSLGAWRWFILLGSMLTCFCARWALGTDYHDKWEAQLEAVAAFSMFTVLVKSDLRVKFLLWKPTIFLGNISFSIYLLHFTVLAVVAKIFELTDVREVEVLWRGMLLAGVTVVLTIPLAWVSYRVAELPGMSVGRRVSAWIKDLGKGGGQPLHAHI